MAALKFFVDLFLNLDVVLASWVTQYGPWIYAMLFLVIFMETGLVVTPFLPGDSLLFTAGAIAAVSNGGLNYWLLIVVLIVAAVLGDGVNYLIGRKFGAGILASHKLQRVIKPEYIESTRNFFTKHGGKTISLARFFPFIRTFAPFMAGMGHMDWWRFSMFNVAGAVVWVFLFVTAGYFFGNIPFVAHNLEYLVIGIIAVSVAPGFIHWVQSRLAARKKSAEAGRGAGSGDVSIEDSERTL